MVRNYGNYGAKIWDSMDAQRVRPAGVTTFPLKGITDLKAISERLSRAFYRLMKFDFRTCLGGGIYETPKALGWYP